MVTKSRAWVRSAPDEELEAAWEMVWEEPNSWERLWISMELSRRGHAEAHEERINKAMRDHPAV